MALAAPSSTLTGQTIAASYDQVLFLDAAAGVTEATLKIVSGTAGKTALQISDEHVLIKGVDTNNAAGFEVQQTDGTSILKIAAGTPAATLIGPLTVGANDLGHDVKLFGATSGKFMLWDEDQDSLMFTDSTNLTFGTGNDADVYYDGTDLNINPKVAGSGRLHILGNASAGIAGTDGTFHAHTASCGSVTAHAQADDLVVENSTTGGMSILTPDANSALIRFGSPSNNNYASFSTAYASGAPSMEIGLLDSTKVTIKSTGYVGIGVTPTQPLHVAKSFNGDYAALIHNTHTTTGQGLMIKAGDGADETVLSIRNQASTVLATFLADGNVGIGDTTPEAHLDVLNTSLEAATGYTGISTHHIKNAGNSTASHTFVGLLQEFQFNDDGAFFNELIGIYNVSYSSASDGYSNTLSGITTNTIMGGNTNPNNVYGILNNVDIDTGTVDDNVFGAKIVIDIEEPVTVTGVVYGIHLGVDCDEDPGGAAILYQADCGTFTDFAWKHYDNDGGTIRSQIGALNGQIDAEGSINTTGLDYAEYFEAKDEKVIVVGTTVKLDGDKIVSCEEGDTPIGVIRPDASSCTIGGNQTFHWQAKFVKDDYGANIWEDFAKTKWSEEITFEEYIARGKDSTGGVEGGTIKDEKVEGSKAIPAKDAVTQQKTVDEEVEEEVTTTEVVLEDGKYVQKTTTETVTKTVKVPQYDEEDLYDEDGEVVGKHQVPIMETVTEAVEAVDAVPDTYFREHKYHSDKLPEGVTAPDDAETFSTGKRQKVNPDYDPAKAEAYKSRADRDEWHIVGLLGQIPITKGQPLADNWIKMKDVSDTIEMYFVK